MDHQNENNNLAMEKNQVEVEESEADYGTEEQFEMTLTTIQMKQDSSIWEYQAPHYYDFLSINQEILDEENEKYFLTDHDFGKNNNKENCLDLMMDDNKVVLVGDDDDEDEQLMIGDNSSTSIYETPNKLSNNTIDSIGFLSARKSYLLRETPLRSLYQNGCTPLKETRPSMTFGKRKSCKKSIVISSTSTTKYLNDENKDYDVVDDATATKLPNDPKEVFDLSEIDKVLKQVNKSLATKQELYDDDNDDDEAIENENEEEEEINEKIFKENLVNVVENHEPSSSLIEIEQKLIVEKEEIVEIVAELSEDDFHEISDQELKPNSGDDDNDDAESKQESDDPKPKISNPLRTSYIVKSPIVIKPKFSKGSVHFESSVLMDIPDTPETTTTTCNDNNSINKSDDPMVTPPTNQAVVDDNNNKNKNVEKSNKIKNRQATPIPRLLNHHQINGKKPSISKERLQRFQKYIKRFSRTPQPEEEAEGGNKEIKVKQDDGDNKENQIGQQKQKVRLVEQKSKKLDDQRNALSKKSISTNQIKLRLSTRPSSTIGHLKNVSRKSTALSSTNSATTTSKTAAVKRFVSLAELSNNFLRSARKYEPKLTMTSKKIKPKSPKLLTAQRASVYKCRQLQLQQQQQQQEEQKPQESVKQQRPIPPTVPQTVTKSRKFITSNISRKPSTKAHTPVFCTDIRLKIHKMKPNQQQQQPKDQQQTKFHARPMPNFKKIHEHHQQQQQQQKLISNENNK